MSWSYPEKSWSSWKDSSSSWPRTPCWIRKLDIGGHRRYDNYDRDNRSEDSGSDATPSAHGR